MEPFQIETTVDAPQATVWRHFTEPALIGQWFGWDHPDIADEIKTIFVDHVERRPPGRIDMHDDQVLTITPAGADRSVVRIVSPGEPTDAFDEIEEGWRQFVEQLRFLLDRGRTGRRTIYLTGRAAPAALATGLDAGPVWHASRFQRMTVDGAGHLVALATQAPVDTVEPADTMVTISTFGLDDAAFAAAEEGWTARWKTLTS